ncbi:hypothetical protein GDO86_002681 [Hymenochirus boettgeri]|uniref:Uncharacterized protein n=1 Tax=Hymenochirus boettgeri TaxID=247094 RepID=A0A8T2K258_9PIPI|nr:hypothetical protein GDO86_002681 [Hymenochirus boettgeri]
MLLRLNEVSGVYNCVCGSFFIKHSLSLWTFLPTLWRNPVLLFHMDQLHYRLFAFREFGVYRLQWTRITNCIHNHCVCFT